MAIDNFFLQLVVQARDFWLKTAGQQGQPARRPLALGLGYPDLLVDDKGLAAYLDAGTIAGLPLRDDSQAIIQWHPSARNLTKIFDSMAVFNALKIDLEVTDMAQHRGCERIVDLNEPLPTEMEQRYDLLIDTGTLEHCFNVGQAFKNMCAAMRQGGILVHAAPLNRYNHGFWSFNPTLYHDFFEDNGYAIRWMKGASVDANGQTQLYDLPPFQGFADAPARSAAALQMAGPAQVSRDAGHAAGKATSAIINAIKLTITWYGLLKATPGAGRPGCPARRG